MGIACDNRGRIDGLIAELQSYRLAAVSERELQEAVASVLNITGTGYEREYRLSGEDRIDFYCNDLRLGIECKIDGSPVEVMRQLLRYTESPEITELVLVTTRSKHIQIPPLLNTIPIHVVLARSF